MKKQRTYLQIQKITLLMFIFIIYFGFVFIINAGVVKNSQAKVCRDVACENPEIIYFNTFEDNPLIIDIEKGLSGKVWGGEFGWITFNPPYGGVFFADTSTGLLKGTAWSETSGAINFSVTGQKVVINPTTGEWNGWAWASGPYGGWIKFDCNDSSSCVRTTWRNENDTENSPVLTVKEKEKGPSSTSTFIKQTKEIFINVINDFYNSFENLYDGMVQLVSIMRDQFSYSFVNLYDGTIQLTKDTFGSLYLSFMNLNVSISMELAKINGSAFITSYKQISKINGSIFIKSYNNWKDISNEMKVAKNKIFNVTGDGVYESFSLLLSTSLNLRASVIDVIDDLLIIK